MWPLLARLTASLGTKLLLGAVIAAVLSGDVLYHRFWSCAATLKKVEVKEAIIEGKVKAETEGLRDDFKRIEAEPSETGKDLVDKLNLAVKKLQEKL